MFSSSLTILKKVLSVIPFLSITEKVIHFIHLQSKFFKEVGTKGTYLSIIKAIYDIYDKATGNIILNGEKLKTFSKTRNGEKLKTFPLRPTLTTFVQHSFGNLSHSYQGRKRNKRSPNWKGRNKTVTVCRWQDTIRLVQK